MLKNFLHVKLNSSTILRFICLLSLSVSNFSYASWQFYDVNLHPVVTVGAGVVSSSTIGESQYFPIQNATTDEFYNYTASKGTQTSGLFQGFIGAETYLFPWIIQAGLDYSQTSPYNAKGTLVQGADANSADTWQYHYSFFTRQLLFEGKLLYTVNNLFHPYVLVGLGAAFNKAYNYSTNAPPKVTHTRMYQNNDDADSFSYALGAGIDVDISSKVRFGIGYRFSNLGTVKLGNATINGKSVGGTLNQNSLYTNALLAQLTWLI